MVSRAGASALQVAEQHFATAIRPLAMVLVGVPSRPLVGALSRCQQWPVARVTGRRTEQIATVRSMAEEPSNPVAGPGADKLREQSCGGTCSKEAVKLSPSEIDNHLVVVPAWKANETQTAISREFVAKNFVAALDFFDKVKDVAEAEGHHPDLHLTNYRNVKVDVSTHSIGGLSLADFILAAKLDQIPVTYSPKWLKTQQAK